MGVKEEIKTFMSYTPVTEEDEQTANKIVKNMQSQGEINCTVCNYCTEVCPKGIKIPEIFAMYNQYKITNDKKMFSMYYDMLADSEKPDSCIRCGMCTKNCPQSLQIPDLLEKVAAEYQEVKGQAVQS